MLILQFIFIQTLVFGVVIYVLKKIMWDNTESAVNRLNESYEEIDQKKEELVEKIKRIEEEYEIKKKEAEEIAIKIRDTAEQESVEKRDALLAKTREEAERIISDAMGAKDRIREEIRTEEQLRMLDFCVDLFTLIFPGIVHEKLNSVLVEDFMGELRGLDVRHLPSDIKELEVVTSIPLKEKQKTEIGEIINKKTKKKIPYKETIDKKLLGGVIMKFGSLVLDGSIASKLKETSIDLKKKVEKEDS